MRILIIYQYFGTPLGGWSTRVYELARRWVLEGATVDVITSPYYKSDIKASGFISRQVIEGINLIIINSGDSNKVSTIQRIIRAVGFALVSSYYTITSRADIVIASSGPITVGIPALLSKLLTKKKLAFEVRDLWPQGAIELGLIRSPILISLGKIFETVCYRSSDLVVPCSTGMERDILLRFPNLKTIVISNASDVDLFTQSAPLSNLPAWTTKPNQKIFIYFGSLGLMDACEEIVIGLSRILDSENIHTVFIGDGSERDRLENLTLELGLSSRIHFIGLIAKSELISWLKIAVASFVVFKNRPVLSTSSPNKMFDSFAAGIPIIHNTTGWIKDLTDEYNCGISVEPEDYDSMAAAIQKFCQMSSESWQVMSASASLLAKQNFNRDILAKDYLRELRTL